MIENKLFAGGGLNQDVDENFLKPNDWTNALNIRNTDRLENSDGVISNVKGNTLVTYTLPAGTNKCIGSYANEQTGKYYSFIYNSNNLHTITEYDNKLGTVATVLQASYLNFQQYELVNGVSIIGGDLLYWTDGFNPPRSIDITKAKTGTYYTNSTSISLAKPPPTTAMSASYANDPTSTTVAINRLKGQLFQFRYLYVYEDGSRSAWSTCSEVPFPELEINSSISTEAFRNNNIVLTFDAGTKYVKTIELAALVKVTSTTGVTQDWFQILSKERSEVLTDPKFAYDSGTNIANYRFYNDGLYQSIDIVETDLSYDFVPLTCKCLDIVNGNVLVLANNKEGYDNISTDVDFDIDYVENTGIERLAVSEIDDTTEFIFSGVPITGDQVNYDIFWYPEGGGPPDPPPGHTESNFLVEAAQSGNLLLVVYRLIGILADATSDNVIGTATSLPDGTVKLSFAMSPGLVSSGAMSITLESSDVTISQASYKTNSKYQFGLVYYDEFNRSTYVQTSDDFILSPSSFGAVSGFQPIINWQINHSAPTGFTSYQWVRTEQLTHKKFLFWEASAVSSEVGKNYYSLNLNTLPQYNIDNPNSILFYDYTPGDRCTIHKVGSEWKTGIDVGVVGFSTTTSSASAVSATLQIENGITLTTGLSEILLVIYTPKTRANEPTQQFFYEFGEVYSCSGGIHSVSAGFFQQGDIFIRERVISDTVTVGIEDPNFSDFYISNVSSNGRTNIFAPQAKQLTLPTDIRYSDTYVPNTNINGLSRFYGNAYETYDRVNGSIQKIAVRDNYLMTFQELKTGYIPILQSIIEDQGGGVDANVAISTKLLNKIRYFAGDYGIGLHPESFARYAGTMYFADPNRGSVLKLTQGLQPISMIGMDSFFTGELSTANVATNGKILGSYDPRNDEYIVSFRYTGSGSKTIAFSEMINRWTTFYSFLPDFGNYIFNKYITYQNGNMYVHNTNPSYGSFYGQNNTAYVELVYNASPSLIKSFIGVMEQASSVWIPAAITTSRNQISTLALDNFTEKEGVFFSSFLREQTGDISSLYFGDDLKGNWIKMVCANTEPTKETLLSVDVRHIPSYQGIK